MNKISMYLIKILYKFFFLKKTFYIQKYTNLYKFFFRMNFIRFFSRIYILNNLIKILEILWYSISLFSSFFITHNPLSLCWKQYTFIIFFTLSINGQHALEHVIWNIFPIHWIWSIFVYTYKWMWIYMNIKIYRFNESWLMYKWINI